MAVCTNSLCMLTSPSLFYSAFLPLILLFLSVHGCPPSESRALLSLKAAFLDPDLYDPYYDMLKSWEGDDCCVWRGVHCDETESSGHVTGLDLGNFHLQLDDMHADIDSALSQLKQLRYLDLSGNDLFGTSFPSGLASLRNLSYLNIADAGFGGNIPPQFGNLSSLRYLDLSYNSFDNNASYQWLSSLSLLKSLSLGGLFFDKMEAKMWNIIGSLFHLTYLDLSGCFHDYPLSVSLLNISSLSVLKFSSNGMSGSIPSWVGNMSKLTSLDLSSNYNLNGSIPSSLSKLHFLDYLDLSANNITDIPEAISNLTNLRHLNLSINKLNGRIPSNLWAMPYNSGNLSYLDLHNNQFEGPIPSTIGLLINLSYLDLSSNRLSGPIPPSVCNLKSLIVLGLHYNLLEGSIPFCIGKISTLRNISLTGNKMSGDLPLSFAQLSSLVNLDLRNNQLNGSIPSVFTLPSSLQTFLLSNNNMTGTVSDRVLLRNSSRLKELDLSDSGQLNIHIDSSPWIPPFQLRILNLRSCKIAGPIPSWISTQFELKDVDLSDANLSGDLPSWLWEFSSVLSSLNLSNNHLEGRLVVSTVPLWLWMLDLSVNELNGTLLLDIQHEVALQVILLAENKIEGPIPDSLGTMRNLMLLDLSNNQLKGNIPVTLGDLNEYLEVLHLENNYLSGEIPTSLGNLSNLVLLNLANNELEGEIPKELGNVTKLASLHLEKNNLRGLLPHSLTQLLELEVLDVGENNLTGTIPDWIANCSNLQILVLRSNNFRGNLPPQIGEMPELRVLDLSSNLLFGEIPNTYLNFTAMVNVKENMSVLGEERQELYFSGEGGAVQNVLGEEAGRKYYIEDLDIITKGSERHYGYVFSSMTCIDLSNNRLWGHLPTEIGNLKGLMFLNFSRNSFKGEIPASMGNLSQLESLDLSVNKLSGEIPFELGSLDYLGYLNLSCNNLSGVIPLQGPHMITFDKSAFSGNPNLRGCPLESWKCSPRHSPLSPPTINIKEETNKGFSWYELSIGWSIAAEFCVVVLVITFKANWRKKTFGQMDRAITFLLGGAH